MIELTETINLNTNKPIFSSEVRNLGPKKPPNVCENDACSKYVGGDNSGTIRDILYCDSILKSSPHKL